MNNVYEGCPPLMSDARFVTDYRPSCDVNNLIQVQNNIRNSYEYRLFLQQNAEQLMRISRGFAQRKNHCSPCDAKAVVWSDVMPLRG